MQLLGANRPLMEEELRHLQHLGRPDGGSGHCQEENLISFQVISAAELGGGLIERKKKKKRKLFLRC